MQKRYCCESDCSSYSPGLSVAVKRVAGSAAVRWRGRLSSGRRHRAGCRDYLTPLSIPVAARTINTRFTPDVYTRDEFGCLAIFLLS